jgi:hypothetical protein
VEEERDDMETQNLACQCAFGDHISKQCDGTENFVPTCRHLFPWIRTPIFFLYPNSDFFPPWFLNWVPAREEAGDRGLNSSENLTPQYKKDKDLVNRRERREREERRERRKRSEEGEEGEKMENYQITYPLCQSSFVFLLSPFPGVNIEDQHHSVLSFHVPGAIPQKKK